MTLTWQLEANHRIKSQQFVWKRFFSQQTVTQMKIGEKKEKLNEAHLHVTGYSMRLVLSHVKIILFSKIPSFLNILIFA